VGLTTKPHYDACAHAPAPRPHAPSAPPPRIVMTRGRHRVIDTSHHFCPNPAYAYRGWVGWGNLRAHGHPNGGPWRQLLCVACRRSFKLWQPWTLAMAAGLTDHVWTLREVLLFRVPPRPQLAIEL